MARTLFINNIGGSKIDIFYVEMAGNSSETKPTSNIAMGSKFREIDTGKTYRFNETSGEWTESSITD